MANTNKLPDLDFDNKDNLPDLDFGELPPLNFDEDKSTWDSVIDTVKDVGEGVVDFGIEVGKGLGRGIDQTQALGGGLVALAGDTLGLDDLADWGVDVYKSNMEEAEQNQAKVREFTDIDSVSDFSNWFGGTLGELVPTVATMIGTGGVGGLVGKEAAKHKVKNLVKDKLENHTGKKLSNEALEKLTNATINKAKKIGFGTGAVGSSVGMETGSIYGDVAQDGYRDAEARLLSLGGGLLAGGLDAIPVINVAKKFGLGDKLKGNIIKRLAKSGITTGTQEAGTEALQTLIEEQTKALIKDENLPDDIAKQMFNASMAGFFGGGALGSIGGIPQSQTDKINRVLPNSLTNSEATTFIENKINELGIKPKTKEIKPIFKEWLTQNQDRFDEAELQKIVSEAKINFELLEQQDDTITPTELNKQLERQELETQPIKTPSLENAQPDEYFDELNKGISKIFNLEYSELPAPQNLAQHNLEQLKLIDESNPLYNEAQRVSGILENELNKQIEKQKPKINKLDFDNPVPPKKTFEKQAKKQGLTEFEFLTNNLQQLNSLDKSQYDEKVLQDLEQNIQEKQERLNELGNINQPIKIGKSAEQLHKDAIKEFANMNEAQRLALKDEYNATDDEYNNWVKEVEQYNNQKEQPIIQNRNRQTLESYQQVNNIANNPDYLRLGTSTRFGDGSPVVIDNGLNSIKGKEQEVATETGRRLKTQYAVVEADDLLPSNDKNGYENKEYNQETNKFKVIAGNGRVAGLQGAYENNKANTYKQNLLDDDLHGISKDDIANMKNPVLVRVMNKNDITDNIGDESNISGISQLSPIELAKNDSNRIGLEQLEFNEDGSFTNNTLNKFIENMPVSEKQNLSSNGVPNKNAVDRLNNMVFYKAFGDNTILKNEAESIDPEIKNIMNALRKSAPNIARLKGLGDYDIRDKIVKALNVAFEASKKREKLSNYIHQQEVFNNNDVKPILQFLADNNKSYNKMADYFNKLSTKLKTESENPEKDLFGNPKQTPQQIIDRLGGVYNQTNGTTNTTKPDVKENNTTETEVQTFDNPQEAIQNTVNTKQTSIIKRDDLGNIAFKWGDDKYGIQHIIKQRKEKDNLTDEDILVLLNNIADTVKNGDITKTLEKGTKHERNIIENNNYRAVLQRENGHYVITGYEKYVSGESGGVVLGLHNKSKDFTPTQVKDTQQPKNLGADNTNNTPIIPESQALEIPPFFKKTENAWVKKQIKKRGLVSDSPGYQNAVNDLKDKYLEVYNDEVKKLTLEQYKALPENKNQPESILESAYKSIKDDTDYSDEARYSLKENNQEFNQAVDKVFAGKRVDITRGGINLGTTPQVLKDLGVPDLPVVMNVEKIALIRDEHSLTADLLKQIPREINNPVMVFKNNKPDSPKNSYVILTELIDNNSKSVITALHTQRKQGQMQVNRIASIYGKDSDKEYVANNIKYGNVVYANKEKSQKVMARLQLPSRLLNGINDIIPQPNNKTPQVEMVESAIKDLPFAKNIKVVATPKDLKVPDNVRGAYKGGDLYLIASNIDTKDEAVQVALHEAVGHKGLKQLLGRQLNRVLDSVYNDMAQDIKPVAKRLGFDVKDINQRREATEEFIAETSETLLNNPNKTPPKFMAKVMSAIRKALRNLKVWNKDVWDKKAILELLAKAKQKVESDNFNNQIDKLIRDKKGQIEKALYHPEIGDIDIIWGKKGTPNKDFKKSYSDGYGLAKILAKHPEINPHNLQDIILRSKIEKKNNYHAVLKDGDYISVIRLTDLDNKGNKKWLLTSYDKSAFLDRTAGVVKDTQSSHPLDEEADSNIIPQQRNSVKQKIPHIPIDESRIPKYKDVNELRDKFVDYAKENLIGKSFYNKDIGEHITINGNGINKALQNSQISKIKNMFMLDKYLENAKFIKEQDDKNGKKDIKWDIFNISNNKEKINLFVRKILNTGNYFYELGIGDLATLHTEARTKSLGNIIPQERKSTKQLLAPNGKPTNLTPKQYEQVRTAEFKEWFGDFENDPENASKVVDENGEPLVVYHGTGTEFNTFDNEKIGSANGTTRGNGFYFGSKNKAKEYGNKQIPVFLNIKKPFDNHGNSNLSKTLSYADDSLTIEEIEKLSDLRIDIFNAYNKSGFDSELFKKAEKKSTDYETYILKKYNYDGVFLSSDKDEIIAFNPSQIKSATDNTGSFSKGNDDIRYSIKENKQFGDNQKYIDTVKEKKKPLSRRARLIFNRHLGHAHNLPKSVFENKIKRDGELKVVEFEISSIIKQFTKSVKDYYKNDKKKQAEILDKAFKGEVVSGIPKNIQDSLLAMRHYIDNFSKRYIKILEQDIKDNNYNTGQTDLLETIKNGLGNYSHRSYRAFDDPKWFKKVDDKVVDNAINEITQNLQQENPSADIDTLKHKAVNIINSIIKSDTAYESMEHFIKESKLGAKDLSTLKKRKEITPAIRELLGEYKDPEVNFVKTATKMGNLIFNHEFLNAVKKNGDGVFLFKDNDRPNEATVKLASDGSDVLAPLNGYYTTPEIKQAFTEILGKEQLGDIYKQWIKINGAIKYGKTVLSPTTQFRNFMSATFFAISNGLVPTPARLLNAVKTLKNHLKKQDSEYWKHLARLGVIHDNPHAGEMMDTIKDFNLDDTLTKGKGYKAVKKVLDITTSLYQYGDDFWKIVGFEAEKQRLIKHAKMDTKTAEVEAAKRIRDTFPTYSMVGRLIKKLRRFPIAGTFVSFPAEIIRTTKNQFKYLKQDLSNKDTRAIGLQRMVGLSITSSIFYALQELGKSMFGIDDDEEEAIRQLSAPWNKNSNILPIGRNKNGQIEYIDLSFIDPYNYWKRPINAIIRNHDDWEQKGIEAIGEMVEPFLGEDMTFGTIMEAVKNKKDTGGKVRNEDDDVIGQGVDIANHLWKNLSPGIIQSATRLKLALNNEITDSGKKYELDDEALAFFGIRKTTLDLKQSLYYKTYNLIDKKRNASSKLNKSLKTFDNLSKNELENIYKEANSINIDAYNEFTNLIKLAKQGGLSTEQILQVLRNSPASKKDIPYLINNKVRNLKPSNTAYKNALRLAKSKLTNKEFLEFQKELKDRFLQLQILYKQHSK